MSKLAALILCLFPITLVAQSTGPVASGYITSIDSDGSFSIEGWPVRVDPKATFIVRDGTAESPLALFTPYVGEFVDLFGSAPKERSKGPILASRVSQVLPIVGDVHGTAIIDLPPKLRASTSCAQTATFSAFRQPLLSSLRTSYAQRPRSPPTYGSRTTARSRETVP